MIQALRRMLVGDGREVAAATARFDEAVVRNGDAARSVRRASLEGVLQSETVIVTIGDLLARMRKEEKCPTP